MRAALLTKYNTPWDLTDLPSPKPAPGQVLIRVHASGMCGTDLHVHRGHMPVTLPIALGHEPVGEIVELGASVAGLRVGDRVGVSWTQKGCGRCRDCQTERALYCGEAQTWMHLGGGNAERMLAWASGCTLLPDGISYEEAAPIFCAGFTVMSGLRNASPKPGERVAVLGIGGLGHLAVQYAKALGLEVVAVTGTEDKRQEATKLGADAVLVAPASEDVGKLLLESGGVDIVLATTNSAAQASQALAGLRPEGRLVNMGVFGEPIKVSAMQFLVGQLVLKGSQQNRRSDLVEALELVAKGSVKPALEVYPLEKANEARERLEAGKVRYRAVLTHQA